MATIHKKGLCTRELIAHLASKGISFNVISEKSAQELLEHGLNYIRIAAMRSLYSKDESGAYHVSFDELYGLYMLDGRLRELLLPLCLELELALRALCLARSYKSGQDGYKIVEAYSSKLGVGRAKKFLSIRFH